MSRTYAALVAAAEAGYRVAVGPTTNRSGTCVVIARGRPAPRAWLLALDRLRTARQKHLLEASHAVRMPSSVRVSSLAALGPHNDGMDFDRRHR